MIDSADKRQWAAPMPIELQQIIKRMEFPIICTVGYKCEDKDSKNDIYITRIEQKDKYEPVVIWYTFEGDTNTALIVTRNKYNAILPISRLQETNFDIQQWLRQARKGDIKLLTTKEDISFDFTIEESRVGFHNLDIDLSSRSPWITDNRNGLEF